MQIPSPDHPFGVGPNSYVMEHRLVMEAHLRETDPASPYLVLIDGALYLSRKAEVHHRNGDGLSNALSNLVVMWKAAHTRLHMVGNRYAVRTTDAQRAAVMRLRRTGKSYRAIAAATGVSRSTARRIVVAYSSG